jgi:2-polyprenyl-3-methyl-5-hydroxy-6-metoxy-1,4-benzoquinol methylase
MSKDLDQYLKAYQGGSTYDFDNKILLHWYPTRIIELSSDKNSILELGLGHGFSATTFSRHFSRHVVLDGSGAVIAKFRKENPNSKAELIETYFEQFETDEGFDVIVMGFVLEHVDNPVAILKHYHHFLNPNGKIYVAVPNAESLNRRLGHLSGFLDNLTRLSEYDAQLGHKRYYTVKTLENDIERANFEVVRMEGIYLKPFTTTQMISLDLDPAVLKALCTMGIEYPELCCGLLAEVRCHT